MTLLGEQKGILDKLIVQVGKKLNPNDDGDIIEGFKKWTRILRK